MYANVSDIRCLLPALPAGDAIDAQITSILGVAETEIKSRLARTVVLSETTTCPIFKNLSMYRSASILLATSFSGSNEQGETKLSEYYDTLYETLFKQIENHEIELLDADGEIIPTSDLTTSLPTMKIQHYPGSSELEGEEASE